MSYGSLQQILITRNMGESVRKMTLFNSRNVFSNLSLSSRRLSNYNNTVFTKNEKGLVKTLYPQQVPIKGRYLSTVMRNEGVFSKMIQGRGQPVLLRQGVSSQATLNNRIFHTSSCKLSEGDKKLSEEDIKLGEEDKKAKPFLDRIVKVELPPRYGEMYTLRMVNENGFLSWTRNSYLSGAVAVTMLNGSNDELFHYAGILVLLVSAMNMMWGSGSHVSNLIRLRDTILMSRLTLFLNILGTVLHALLWAYAVLLYLSKMRSKFSRSRHQNCKQPEESPFDKE